MPSNLKSQCVHIQIRCNTKYSEIRFFQHFNEASPDYYVHLAISTPEKKMKFKMHTGCASKIVLFTVRFQDKAGNRISSTSVSRSLKRWKRLEMNPITLGWENSPKLPRNCKIMIWQIFARFWSFFCLGWLDWFLVFCIFSGPLFRVPTGHTLMIFFSGFISKMNHKKGNSGNAPSVNFEFSVIFSVHIATCTQ